MLAGICSQQREVRAPRSPPPHSSRHTSEDTVQRHFVGATCRRAPPGACLRFAPDSLLQMTPDALGDLRPRAPARAPLCISPRRERTACCHTAPPLPRGGGRGGRRRLVLKEDFQRLVKDEGQRHLRRHPSHSPIHALAHTPTRAHAFVSTDARVAHTCPSSYTARGAQRRMRRHAPDRAAQCAQTEHIQNTCPRIRGAMAAVLTLVLLCAPVCTRCCCKGARVLLQDRP
jgi:hypothetical protein